MGAKKLSPSLLPCKKITNPNKVPNITISRAKREKMKREHLNELFLGLSNALEIREENNGKAFILDETNRIFKCMIDQITRLKEENATLLSESQYMTTEKNELEYETRALDIQIGELKSVVQKMPDLNESPIESQELDL
ncbi:transcription factor bHLH47-like [Lactuca sativa]|uniref:transcription factor bHLH47-like n=1 Tax=Lactuca sativa TaxID=4236 RepID=UPI000CD89520|nr:transcription factor bHLH47-like [Lactuca sativa]